MAGHIVLSLSIIPDSVSAHYLIILVIRGHFQMKFGTYVCHVNPQADIEFGSGRIIFGRVMPFGLRKIPLIFSFRSLSPILIDIVN